MHGSRAMWYTVRRESEIPQHEIGTGSLLCTPFKCNLKTGMGSEETWAWFFRPQTQDSKTDRVYKWRRSDCATTKRIIHVYTSACLVLVASTPK